MLTSVTGINWGDEGKGRIVDLLTEKADYVVRYQGGNNAGHTVVTDQGKFVLNLLPSGILHPTAVCVLGNGMVIDPDHLRHEIAMMQYMKVKVDASNLKISDKATICMPFHVRQDVLEEERLSKTGSAFGSTRRGIAYAYGDKYMKKTLRLGDLLELDAPSVQHRLKVIIDSKNLVLENVYNQEPLSYDEIMEWCRSQAEFFKDISAMWEHCSVLLPIRGKIFCLRRSLERSAILIMAFTRLHPAPIRSQAMRRSVPVFRAARSTTW